MTTSFGDALDDLMAKNRALVSMMREARDTAILGEPDNSRGRGAASAMAERLLYKIRALAVGPEAVRKIVEGKA